MPEVDRYRMVDPYSAAGAKEVRRQRLPYRIAVIVAVVLVAALAAFCAWDALRAPAIAAYADTPITVTGLEEVDLTVTPEELVRLDCVTESVSGSGQAGTTKSAEAYGPTLATFLAQYGYAPTDFKRAIITCKDDYTVVLTPEMLEGEVILSVAQGKEALDEWQQPLRMVMPAQESGMWAYGVKSMVFER